MKFLCTKCHKLYCTDINYPHRNTNGKCEICGKRSNYLYICYAYDFRKKPVLAFSRN